MSDWQFETGNPSEPDVTAGSRYWCEKGEVRLDLIEMLWEGWVFLGGKKYKIGGKYDSGPVAQGVVERGWEREMIPSK